LNEDGATCAVGELALLAGVDKQTLLDASIRNISADVDVYPPLGVIQKAITKNLGLNVRQLQDIQQLNDDNAESVEDRQRLILAYLDAQFPDLKDPAPEQPDNAA
jgi:hypothetical protein